MSASPPRGARSLTTADVTYVSLSEDNPELKRYMPWTGTHKGPESLVEVLTAVGKAWETKAFAVRDVIEQGDSVAMFGSFTYRGRESGKERGIRRGPTVMRFNQLEGESSLFGQFAHDGSAIGIGLVEEQELGALWVRSSRRGRRDRSSAWRARSRSSKASPSIGPSGCPGYSA